jgi:hypothetical protein
MINAILGSIVQLMGEMVGNHDSFNSGYSLRHQYQQLLDRWPTRK